MINQHVLRDSFTTRLFLPSVHLSVSPYMSHDQYMQRHSPDASLPGRACFYFGPHWNTNDAFGKRRISLKLTFHLEWCQCPAVVWCRSSRRHFPPILLANPDDEGASQGWCSKAQSTPQCLEPGTIIWNESKNTFDLWDLQRNLAFPFLLWVVWGSLWFLLAKWVYRMHEICRVG